MQREDEEEVISVAIEHLAFFYFTQVSTKKKKNPKVSL